MRHPITSNSILKTFGRVALRTVLPILLAACVACSARPIRGKTHVLVVASDYSGASGNVRALDNPLPDADSVSRMFKRIRRVNVQEVKNPTTDEFVDAIEQLVARLSPGDTAMLYFAGHGLQANGRSYFVSSDGTKVFEVDEILSRLMRQSDPTIFVIDACRNNAFAPDNNPRTSEYAGGRSIANESTIIETPSRGAALAPLPQSRPVTAIPIDALGDTRRALGPLSHLGARNALVLFSTLPGRVAEDGESGKGSEFAKIFVEEMPKRQSLDVIFNRISERVSEKTGFRQNPWPQGLTNRKVYIAGKPRRPVAYQ